MMAYKDCVWNYTLAFPLLVIMQSLYERSSIKRRARTKNMNMQNVPEALLSFSEMEQ